MRIILATLAIAAFLVSPIQARAQAASVSAETIVVTGHRTGESLQRAVTGFVRAHGRYSPRIDQITRWQLAICPQVQGLPQAFDDFIAARIGAVARSVAAPTSSEPGCSPNIEIIFTAEPQTLIDQIARRSPHLLGFHFASQSQQMRRVTMPIQAWYVTATMHGTEIVVDNPMVNNPGGCAGSRLTECLRSVFLNVLIVVDTGVIAGRPVGPIADYLALLSLSHMADEGEVTCGELASVANYLASDCAENVKSESLSDADAAYLRGLYQMNPTYVGPLERAQIHEQMMSSLGGQ
jgi:hypothetical protein